MIAWQWLIPLVIASFCCGWAVGDWRAERERDRSDPSA